MGQYGLCDNGDLVFTWPSVRLSVHTNGLSSAPVCKQGRNFAFKHPLVSAVNRMATRTLRTKKWKQKENRVFSQLNFNVYTDVFFLHKLSSYGEVFLNFFLMVKRNVYATLLLHNFQRISNVLAEELLNVTSQCLFTDSIVVCFSVKFKLGVIRHDHLSAHYHHKYSVTSMLSRRRDGLPQNSTVIISSMLGYYN